MMEKNKNTPLHKYIDALYRRTIRQKTSYLPKHGANKRKLMGRRIVPYASPHENRPPDWAKQTKYEP